MLEELTEYQQSKLADYVKNGAKIGNSVVPSEVYTDEVIESIKIAVQKMYKAANHSIKKEDILISPSVIMSPFIAAAHMVGKVGTPGKPVKSKLENMKAVEDFLNGFENPKAIIKKSEQFLKVRFWGSLNIGFWSFISFFMNETSLGKNELLKFKEINDIMFNEICHLTYDLIIAEDLCVVSKKPIYQDIDNSGEYPVTCGGKIVWSDGTVIKY